MERSFDYLCSAVNVILTYIMESKVWQPLYREDILDWFTVVYVLR